MEMVPALPHLPLSLCLKEGTAERCDGLLFFFFKGKGMGLTIAHYILCLKEGKEEMGRPTRFSLNLQNRGDGG